MTPILIFLLLCLAAFVLMALEVFVPGGILGLIGAGTLLVACAYAFTVFEPATATWISLVLVFGTMCAFLVWLIKMPDSRIGKKFALASDLHDSKSSIKESDEPMVGKRGTAVTDLRPGGVVRVDGKRMDVVCNRGYVDQGSDIEIVEARGNHIVVREASGGTT